MNVVSIATVSPAAITDTTTSVDGAAEPVGEDEYNQDAALIADHAKLSLVERLRAATKAAQVLQRLADAQAARR